MLLKQYLSKHMESQHEQDKERTSKSDHPSKKQDYICATCRDWLQAIEADWPKTHLVELTDLTFVIFSCYLTTFKKEAAKRTPSDSDEAKTTGIHLGASAFEEFCSVLSYFYLKIEIDKETTNKDLWSKLLMHKKGSCCTITRERKKLKMSTVDGKQSFSVCSVPATCKDNVSEQEG